ncbi:cytochrome c biogenesis CcdA family protein [Paenarthrobacter sp. DKR-5]|uniref:cytochrome c biogenesis CcdA family protein n=1 Tax=Paenarthrobacter sp. DKR-5 TaxID=2835535 RepID=UPI001BDCFA9A|nr:cytochrome c biogenesis CcdA family protein [Paenarthrobacter sp. DKR-5]MBT1004394.1 cytochrome c biogenesis CcdA family protein [Paenarthrobacter sp. DKR-5]
MLIGYAGAFLGGLLTLLSPCAAMLLPAFFAYAFSATRLLLARTLVFYGGLLATLVPLGVFAGIVGGLLTAHRELLIAAAAAAVILLGVLQLAGVSWPRLPGTQSGGTSWLAVLVLGASYGVAGACTGPILGSILMIAAAGGTALYGAILLALYALGMVVPLLVLAAVWDRLGPTRRSYLKPRRLKIGRWSNSWATLAAGLLSVGIGALLLLTDGTAGAAGILSADQQFALEISARRTASGLSDPLFALAAGLVLAVTIFAFRLRGRSTRPSAGNPPVINNAPEAIEEDP